jgi:cytochrome c oxidase assembly protein subunit 15
MTRSTQHVWLARFAWLAAAATFILIGLGGVVTSKGAGMAVPDWPTTYGYNMFLFPVHLWTGGILYEHTHRLFASGVGMLTAILAVWLWLRESRSWLRWMGVAAFILVVLQGVLGGLRVTLYKDEIGIVHATVAQLFFVLMTWIALFTSGAGERLIAAAQRRVASPLLRSLILTGTLLVFVQLVLGASMRHQHAGLAVPDFPLAYGQLWPPTDAGFIERINQNRLGFEQFKPITASQIVLHMSHRLGAFVLVLTVVMAAWVARREQGRGAILSRLALGWLLLLAAQASLGAATVWTNKAADVATAHVLTGALALLAGVVLSAAAMASVVRVPSLARFRSASPLLAHGPLNPLFKSR